MALKFGPPEYFSLILLALIATGGIMEKNWFKPIFSLTIGLLISTVGIDLITGDQRFTFGVLEIMDGIDFVVIIIGLFGISEVLKLLEKRNDEIDLKETQKLSYKSL